MDESVMMTAEEDAVLQTRFPAIGPMLHMVRIGETEPAPGKAASAVPDLECAPKGRGDRAGTSSDAEDGSVGSVTDADDTGIAAYPSRRFSGNAGNILQLGPTRLPFFRKGRGFDMEDDLISFCSGAGDGD
jgi:hypothetical protein